MSPSVETQFKAWLKATASPVIADNRQPSTENVKPTTRIQKVVEIGGETPGSDHGLSIALQIDFPDKATADNWTADNLPAILGSFMGQFGPNAAFLTTLLESSSFI